MKICLFKFGGNLTKSRGIRIEGEYEFSSLVFLSCFSENPHQKNALGPAGRREAWQLFIISNAYIKIWLATQLS